MTEIYCNSDTSKIRRIQYIAEAVRHHLNSLVLTICLEGPHDRHKGHSSDSFAYVGLDFGFLLLALFLKRLQHGSVAYNVGPD